MGLDFGGLKNAKFSKFEDQGPEDDKDLGPGPPLRNVTGPSPGPCQP